MARILNAQQARVELTDPLCPECLDVILRVRGTLHMVKEGLCPEDALAATLSALEDGFQVEVEEQPSPAELERTEQEDAEYLEAFEAALFR